MNKSNTRFNRFSRLMKATFVWMVLILSYHNTEAQLTNIPVTGFNNDVIANGIGATNTATTGTIPGVTYPTIGVDGNGPSAYTFVDNTYKWYSGSASFPTCGIPATVSSAQTPGLVYTLQSATTNNVLTVCSNTYSGSVHPTSAAVSLVTPASYGKLYVLYETVLNTAGPTITATITFSDLSTQVISGISVVNWFTNTNAAYTNNQRAQNAAPGTPSTCGSGPYLFEMPLNILPANYSKLVQSVTFNWSAAIGSAVNTVDYLHVMAVGGLPPCSVPVDQPSALNLNAPSNTSITATFTGAPSVPSGYLCVAYPGGSAVTTPVSGTNYVVGNSLGLGKVVGVGATTGFSATGLFPGVTYDIYVYSYNSGTCATAYNTTSPLTGSITTPSVGSTLVISPYGDGGFESGPTFASNGWTVVNGATNNWFVGATATPASGSRSAFIDNGTGLTNAYTTTASSTVHFYRDVTFPAGQTIINLSFKWKNQGESSYDYITVYAIPTTTTPVVNSPAGGLSSWLNFPTAYPGAVIYSSPPNLNLNSAYQTQSICLPASFAGTTQRLVFAWSNDNSSGTQPPGSVDDIALVTNVANGPANQATSLILNTISTSQINGSFTAALSNPTGYLVVRYPTGSATTAPVNGTSYSVGNALGLGTVVSVGVATTFNNAGLLGGTTYDYYVYDYNTLTCLGPAYNTTLPLTGTQSTSPCGSMSGVIPIGATAPPSPGGFPTLTAALAYINANGLGGATTLELQIDYNVSGETYPITFPNNPCINSVNNLTVRPSSFVASPFVFTNSNTSGTFLFDGGSYVTIDGRPGGTGSSKFIRIINTSSTAASAGNAILMKNDASNNFLTYLDLQASNLNPAGNTGTSTVGAVPGVVAIWNTTGANGNDNNTISFCDIHSATSAGNILNVGVYAYNSSAVGNAANNDNNTITNCNIYDCFHATTATAGIDILVGNNTWTISNNSFYKSAALTYTYTAAIAHRGIWVTPNASAVASSGFVITGNYFGGTAPNCGGSSYAFTSTLANIYDAMDISVGTASFTSIQNNTITNMSMTTGNTGSTAFVGINIANGNVNIGTVTGNLIGSTTTNGSITFTATANTGGFIGIRTGAGTTINISNNIISGIDLIGSGTITPVFNGINAGGGTTVNINNNTIGSLTLANSINALSAYTGTSVQTIRGIIVNAGTTSTVTNNTISNMNSNIISTGTTGHTVVGVAVTTTTSTVSGNTIRNLTSSSQSTSGGSTPSVIGIAYTATTAPATISGNTIHTLKNTNTTTTSGPVVAGIYYGGASGTSNLIEKNFIHSLVLSSTTVNASAAITGMDIATGQVTIKNNMIRLGYDENGNSIIVPTLVRGITKNTNIANIYFNSIYIGGTGVLGTVAANTFAFTRTAAASSDDVRNNIFVNNRSNATTGGKHYQVNLTSVATLTMNYNAYYGVGTGTVFASNVGVDVASYSPGWVSGDLNSQVGDPQFINPTGGANTVNLHIDPVLQTVVEQTGITIGSVTDDIDSQNRSLLTPDDIGADAGNFSPFNACSGPPASATASLTVAGGVCGSGSKTIVLTGFTSQPGFTYQWQESASGLPGSFVNVTTGTGGTTNAYTTATITSSMYYQCIIGCAYGAGNIASSSVQVVINPAPVMTISPLTGTNVCSGSNVDLTATGALTYSWAVNPGVSGYPIVSLLSTPNNLATVTSRPTSTLASSVAVPPATVSTPTWTYTVTGTSANGCTSTAVTVLNVITTPVVPLQLTYTNAPDPVCAPGTPITFTVNNPGSIGAGTWTYNWYDQTGTTLLQSTTNSLSTDTYTPSTPVANGNYIYKVKVTNSLCPSSYAVASPTYFVGYTSLNVVTNANCGDNGVLNVYPEGQTNFSTWYSNNFNTGLNGPAFDALYGNAVISGGVCNVTTQATSQNGTLLIRNPAAINSNNLQVDFKLSTAPRGFAFNILGADGLAWSYAPDVWQGQLTPGTGGFQAEGGSGTGFKLAFDATANGAGNTPGCYLMYNCTTPDQGPTSPGVLAFKQGSWWQGLVNAPVSIIITQNGFVTVTINNEVIFDHVALPAAYLTANKSNWLHAFTARTGGSSELHAIDDLNIRYNTYEFSNNSTNGTDGTWQTSNKFSGLAAGSYPVWVRNPSNPSCVTNTGTAVVGTSASPSSALTVPVSGFNTTICAGSVTELTTDVSIPGATFLWESSANLGGPYSAAVGTNNAGTYTTAALLSNTYFRCTFTCPSASPITSTPVLVTVNSGSIASTNSPQTINCIGSSATLTATPGANTTVVWYAAVTGGSPLATGNSYSVTPSSLPVTYYAEPVTTLFTNHYNEGGQKVIANTFGTASSSTSIATVFSTSASIRIDSIKVLPGATGTLTVALQNAGSATNLQTFNATITAAQVGSFINVPVNFSITGSGNYQLTTTGVACTYYSSYTGTYSAPYMSLGGVFSITGAALSPTSAGSTSYYGTAFNWSITTSCPAGTGARVPVVVNSNPTYLVSVTPATLSNFCPNTIQTITASSPNPYSSYTWSPVTNLYSDAGATVPLTLTDNQAVVYFKATGAGSNTYTVSTAGSGCTNTATSSISVQAALPIVTTANPSTVCSGSNVQLNASVSSSTYNVTSIPFAPEPVPATASTISGDEATQTVNLGFSFGYFGNVYTDVILHTNGYVQLGGSTTTCTSCYSPPTAPSTSTPNNWVGIWADMSVTAGQVTYGTTGVAPNRKFIVNYDNVNFFSATPASTHQIILNEFDGSIEIHLTSNTTTSLNARALGIENAGGTVAFIPANRNSGTWTATNESWKFTPVVPSYNYDWSSNPLFLSATNISNPVAQVITSTQTYSVQVVDANTGCTSVSNVTVNVSPVPDPIASSNTPVCEGTGLSLISDNLAQVSGNTFTWTGPNGFISASQNPTVTGSAALSNAGNYIVTITNSFNCTAVDTAVVVVNSNPVMTVTPHGVSCTGLCDGDATITVAGGQAPFLFYDGINFSNDGIYVDEYCAGPQSVDVFDNNGCTSTTTFNIGTISTAPPSSSLFIPAGSFPASGCVGQTVNVVCNTVPGATEYKWSVNAGTMINGQNGSATTTTPNATLTLGAIPANVSNWEICVFAQNGCGVTNTKCFSIRGNLSTPAPITGSTVACPSTSGTYSIPAVGGAEAYQWTGTNGITFTGSGTTVTANFPAGFTSGTICVAGKLNCGYTGPTRCITVSNSSPNLGAMSGPFSLCPGAINQVFSVPAAAGAASYTWSVPANVSIVSGQGTPSLTVNVGAGFVTGNICVYATSNCGVQTALRCKTMSSTQPLTPGNITGQSSGVCGQTITYSVPAVAGVTSYNWSVTGAGASISSANGSNNINVTYSGGFTTGTVCVVASNACGNSASRCINVKGAPADPGAISGPVSVCAGEQGLTFSVTAVQGATSYVWIFPAGVSVVTGSGTNSIIVDWGSVGGTVTVRATNGCGTSGTKSLTVAVGCKVSGNALPGTEVTAYPNPVRNLLTVELNAVHSGNYTIELSDVSGRVIYNQVVEAISGMNNSTIDVSKYNSGIYMLTVKNAEGFMQQLRVAVE